MTIKCDKLGDGAYKNERKPNLHGKVNPIPVAASLISTILFGFGYVEGLDSSAHNIASLWLYCAAIIFVSIALSFVISRWWWVAICTALGLASVGISWNLQARWQTENASKPLQSQSVPSELDSPLSPKQIKDQIDNALPYQQDGVEKSFENAPVSWTLYLFAIGRDSTWGPNQLRVAMTSGDSILQEEVYATVPVDGNEKLSMLSRGAPLRVKGLIEKVDTIGISIKNGTIDVLPESFRIKEKMPDTEQSFFSDIMLGCIFASSTCFILLAFLPKKSQ